jgi:phage protein D
MTNARGPAGSDDVERAVEMNGRRRSRVLHARGYEGDGGEMEHGIRLVSPEDAHQRLSITDVTPVHGERAMIRKRSPAATEEVVVDDDHTDALGEKPPAQRGPDEAETTRDESGLDRMAWAAAGDHVRRSSTGLS